MFVFFVRTLKDCEQTVGCCFHCMYSANFFWKKGILCQNSPHLWGFTKFLNMKWFTFCMHPHFLPLSHITHSSQSLLPFFTAMNNAFDVFCCFLINTGKLTFFIAMNNAGQHIKFKNKTYTCWKIFWNYSSKAKMQLEHKFFKYFILFTLLFRVYRKLKQRY